MNRQSDLAALGWKAFYADQVSPEEARHCVPVRVMAVHRGEIAIAGAGLEQTVPSHLASSRGEEDRPAVGDWLLIDHETHEPQRILDRASLFKRRSAGAHRRVQLIAANVDTVFIVTSCDDDFNVARLERFLVLAGEVGVRPVVVLTKIDLTESVSDYRIAAESLQDGLEVVTVDARNPDHVARLAALCAKGETVALLGSSGVGKSTLVNTLRGSDDIATQAVRVHDGKGMHTTTVRQMHRLAHGGWLLDTPGMREFQIADAATGLAEVFDDIVSLARQCQFRNCRHGTEPGCAISSAVKAGKLTARRLERWRKLAAEDADNSLTRKERPGGYR
ncbi:ribosome small subunit-dependent GTPase A [Altererythrobacter sp. TH136]|uniref:ribosome small subunit-dependent GTPase A n=1 Tax=Altererythrobacter sp. TH136 TaxID=2067415 RepID=UPI001FF0714D|nr:ribosome small subunit-dependent GTPase A [Altererythrobacter sp. TH136]